VFSRPVWRRRHRIAERGALLAEIIASDVSLLVTFNQAIEGVIQNNPKARANPKALAQLDGDSAEKPSWYFVISIE
jgi:hypothetical protein